VKNRAEALQGNWVEETANGREQQWSTARRDPGNQRVYRRYADAMAGCNLSQSTLSNWAVEVDLRSSTIRSASRSSFIGRYSLDVSGTSNRMNLSSPNQRAHLRLLSLSSPLATAFSGVHHLHARKYISLFEPGLREICKIVNALPTSRCMVTNKGSTSPLHLYHSHYYR